MHQTKSPIIRGGKGGMKGEGWVGGDIELETFSQRAKCNYQSCV